MTASSSVMIGDALLTRLARETQTRTLEVIGARLEEGLPPTPSIVSARGPAEDESRVLCTQVALLCGRTPPEQDFWISWRDANTEWARALALLDHLRVAFRRLPMNVGAVDQAIYNGCVVMTTLAPGVLLREPAMVAVIALLVDWEEGTLARLVADASGMFHLIDATDFRLAQAPGAVVATHEMFDPVFPPPSVSRTFEPA